MKVRILTISMCQKVSFIISFLHTIVSYIPFIKNLIRQTDGKPNELGQMPKCILEGLKADEFEKIG